MAFSIPRLREQLAAAPLASPYPHELALAVICDVFRAANQRPPRREAFVQFERHHGHPLWREQVGMLAHVLASTALREETVKALDATRAPMARLEQFFEEIQPLTAEMVRANAFRQEEFLRVWIRGMGGEIEHETPATSKQRLEQLDYRKALADFRAAESARKKEAERREQLIQEAARREAEARGWRE
ncbi:hypothetical protein JGU66_06860 [Myxococcaceae bacterium JPH2]|nr:hypothetical protein [Myxococcaceae bacterium JPH2]